MDYLYIVRHGQTHWNVERRMQGRLDSPLSNTGREQAAANGLVLQREGVTHMLASPLGRTRETAGLIASHTGSPVDFDDRLVERDVGDWSGFTIDEIRQHFPTEWQARSADAYHHRPPRGENLPDMAVRIRPLLATLNGIDAERVGLVTHGVMARVILTELLGLAPEQSLAVRVPNDVVYCVRLIDAPQVRHFRAGAGPFDGLLGDDAPPG